MNKTFIAAIFLSISLSVLAQQNEKITDIDGNVYNTIRVGTDIWMTENLAVTRYNDGTPIPFVTCPDEWIVTLSPACRWYNNDQAGLKHFGVLYNWYVIETGKLCPSGWHVPTDNEWKSLSWFVGGDLIAGLKLREEGNKNWEPSKYQGTNDIGFGALPAGFVHDFTGETSSIYNYASFWTASEYSRAFGWGRSIHINHPELRRFNDGKKGGFSVRCVKD